MSLSKKLEALGKYLRGSKPDGYSSGGESKARYLRTGKQTMEALAEALGYEKGQARVRINPAGPAVAGDVVLHTPSLYVSISDCAWMGLGIMYRSVTGLADYRGGPNQWLPITEFLNERVLVETLKPLCKNEPAA